LYEPATAKMNESFKDMLRPADTTDTDGPTDSMYMIIFGGKNALTEQMFNDIYFLGVPSFKWYIPKASVYNIESNLIPAARLGHSAAI